MASKLAKDVCVNDNPTDTITDVIYVERGYKRYGLSNHLGNLLTTISDKRLC